MAIAASLLTAVLFLFMLKHSVTAWTVCYWPCAAVNCSCDVCIVPDEHTYGQKSRAAKRFYCCVCFAGLRFSVLVQLPSCRQCTFNVPQCQEIGHSRQVGQTPGTFFIWCNTLVQLLLPMHSFDSNIILMLADDMACNARNPRPGT